MVSGVACSLGLSERTGSFLGMRRPPFCSNSSFFKGLFSLHRGFPAILKGPHLVVVDVEFYERLLGWVSFRRVGLRGF